MSLQLLDLVLVLVDELGVLGENVLDLLPVHALELGLLTV